MIALTIYSRPGCHLCEEMKAVVARIVRSAREPIRVSEIDISTDPDLDARYGLEIPVLMVEGTKVAKYRIDEGTLRRILDARSAPGAQKPME